MAVWFGVRFIEMKEQWRQRKQTTLTNTISLRQARELLLVKELKNNRDRKQTTLYMRSGAGSFLKVLLTNFDFLARLNKSGKHWICMRDNWRNWMHSTA
ncbi:hypothetical protein POPTR_014G133450v4 [Populus trichocarpa]|uniref:Uncharacterized protein n=4 Tax=Populus trichocarpa TaxID=3694 RepID=A0ACC0RZF6_POPTR|nr:hypothetical protein POPTR_014G133450v4 [Populus trichocarpa]